MQSANSKIKDSDYSTVKSLIKDHFHERPCKPLKKLFPSGFHGNKHFTKDQSSSMTTFLKPFLFPCNRIPNKR